MRSSRNHHDSRSPVGLPDWIRVWPDGLVEYASRHVQCGGHDHFVCGRVPVQKEQYGYLHVSCRIDGRMRVLRVHRLVMLAFAWQEGCDSLDVNHKNGLRSDNRIENLEWCTRSENHLHAYRVLGRAPAMKGRASPRKGKRFPHLHSPVLATSLTDGAVRSFDCIADVAQAGFAASAVSHCLAGRKKTHRGHSWSRAER